MSNQVLDDWIVKYKFNIQTNEDNVCQFGLSDLISQLKLNC